jgi:uncharacterized protein RhaS with RHS repeats
MGHRYYSPEFCRFIQPDDIEYIDQQSINGLNLYAYCNNNPVNKYDPSGHIAISAFFIGAAIGLLVEFAVDYFEDNTRTIDHSLLDYVAAGVSGTISGGLGSSSNVLLRLSGAVIGSVAQGAISENKDYSLDSFKRDLTIGAASFGIAESITIMGKKLIRGWFNKATNNTTKEASKQLRQFANGNTVNNFKPNAQKILSKLSFYDFVLSGTEKTTGALYSFATSMAHSKIFNW